MITVWSSLAERDRADAIAYIAQDSILSAIALDDRLEEVSRLLAEQPFIGPPGLKEGTREFVATPAYKVVYEVKPDLVYITALVHTARNRPSP